MGELAIRLMGGQKEDAIVSIRQIGTGSMTGGNNASPTIQAGSVKAPKDCDAVLIGVGGALSNDFYLSSILPGMVRFAVLIFRNDPSSPWGGYQLNINSYGTYYNTTSLNTTATTNADGSTTLSWPKISQVAATGGSNHTFRIYGFFKKT